MVIKNTIKKQEKSQINNIPFQLEELEKEKQTKPKVIKDNTKD